MSLHFYLGQAKRPLNKLARRIRCALFNHAVVLGYHRIADLETDSQSLAVSPAHFRDHLLHLKKNHVLLTPMELNAHALANTLPKRAVVLTFDDGYADNFLTMLPIIESLRVPVTVFVSTDLLDSGQEFWWDELERILLVAQTLPENLEFSGTSGSMTLPMRTPGDRMKAYHKVHSWVKVLRPDDRNAFLTFLRDWAGIGKDGRDSHRCMTAEELKALSKSPYVTIGAHSRSHAVLSMLEPQEQRAEMAGSKSVLEAIMGREVDFFAYPFGTKSEYTPETARLCRDTGFHGAYANFYGHVFNTTDLYQIPRMLVRNWGRSEFQKRLNGFFKG